MLRDDPAYAKKAARVSELAMDVCEYLDRIGLPPTFLRDFRVAYHAACSLQHGQNVTEVPKRLLENAGFKVVTPTQAHLCCGSAGTYNILQSELADKLGQRKADAIARLDADVIATGNIGCMTRVARFMQTPIVHTVELLDWAFGGPKPLAIDQLTRPS